MESVLVALRIRPMINIERERGCQEAIQQIPNQPQVLLTNEAFTYNFVFGAKDSQEDLYKNAVLPLLHKLPAGFNVTILAYGQTGSGKTHTMGTTFNGVLNEETGVIPRSIAYIFQKIQDLKDEYTFEVKCSFLELYKEQLYDLLSGKERDQSTVDIREDRNGICIPDLTYQVVNSADETTNCLMRGSAGRAVASTAMNEHSSRSHAIFTVVLQFTKNDESQTLTTAKFHLVDLAGSERSNKTKATGERFKEGVKINHGLLALGNVISALGSGKSAGFVPYRDSKLTRLLQDSLGGNSITLMIACVSPADYNTSETLSTLRYADRARKIKNKPIVNQDPHAAEVNRLKGIIQKLRLELLSTGSGSNSSLDTASDQQGKSPRKVSNDKMYRELQEKYRNLQQKLQKTFHDVMENEMRAHIAEAAHEKLKEKTDELKKVAVELEAGLPAENCDTGWSPKFVKEHVKKIRHIVQMTIGIDEEVEKTFSEIIDHKQQASLAANICSDDETELSEEGGAEIEKEADVYNNKQFLFKEQLSRINRELNLKEQLQQRIAGNLTKFHTLDTTFDGKVEECQHKIQKLEDEKAELMEKLSHVKENASAKIAEERRKRLQTLEQEIAAMKSKIKQQSSLLKVREKETQKVHNLNREIQAMKESKVKLVRTMRQEAENFRQWKLTREKELMQMKNKGRKLENEMARKEALHAKQRNVLKRKCEEATAINKRLKDALEKQSAAQALRHKLQSTKDSNGKRVDQVVCLMERELEVITSLIDAEQSLEHLMEDRSMISRRINELQQVDSDADELKQLEEELEMRNAQISELQQKVCAADLDARMRVMCECVQNMAESRAVFKQLLNSVCEMRRENGNRLQEQKTDWEEQRAQRQLAEDEYQKLLKRLNLMEKEHNEAMAAIERSYEEKIALLLSTTHVVAAVNSDEGTGVISTPTAEQMERINIQREMFDKMEKMHEEIEKYKMQIRELTFLNGARNKIAKPKPKAIKTLIEEDEILDITTEDEDFKADEDPDWKMESVSRPRKRKHLQQMQRKTDSIDSTTSLSTSKGDDTYTTAMSQQSEDTDRKKAKKCKCRTNCTTNKCGCRKEGQMCKSYCCCSESCNNGKNIQSDSIEADDESDQNIVPINVTYNAETRENGSNLIHTLSAVPNTSNASSNFLKPSVPLSSPPPVDMDEKARRIARLTTINFNTPTTKKKFFE